MRKLPAGLFSLALAATTGLGIAAATAGNAATPSKQGSAPSASEPAPASDELPNPLEDKRRELRQEALTKVINGQAKPEQRNGSTVVKLGTKAAGAKGGKSAKSAKARVDQYVELGREKTDRIFVVLAEFGNERHPDYPDKDTGAEHPRPGHLRGPAAQRDPGAGPIGGQLHRLAGRLQPEALPGHVLRQRQLREEVLREAVVRPLLGVDGEVTDWVKVKYNEARYGRSNGFPCAEQRLQQHLEPGRRTR